jgi:ribonuclease Z
MPVNFAEPLPQSTRSEILEWRFPRPYHNYVLTGRSKAAWHTAFIIPHLNLLLDAGLCVNKLRPKHVFITHGHSDHTLLAPAL